MKADEDKDNVTTRSSGVAGLDLTPSPRFEIDDPAWLAYLETHGYVVVANVLTETDIAEAKGLMYDYLAKISTQMIESKHCLDPDEKPFDPKDIETWNVMPINWGTGISTGYSSGQADFNWYIRTRPKVRAAYEKIWKTEDLIVSFDGFNLFRPWQLNEKWKTNNGWYHVDQTPRQGHTGRECIQGLVNLYDTSPETGGLTVVPDSQNRFLEYTDQVCYDGYRDHIPLNLEKIGETTKPRLVISKKGDLCLWDSRTIHCNSSGRGLAQVPDGENPEFMRIACYICMGPTSKSNGMELKERLSAYRDHLTSTHWPHDFLLTNQDLLTVKRSLETPEMLRLVRGNAELPD